MKYIGTQYLMLFDINDNIVIVVARCRTNEVFISWLYIHRNMQLGVLIIINDEKDNDH